jgi:hypothetical protein
VRIRRQAKKTPEIIRSWTLVNSIDAAFHPARLMATMLKC